MHWVAAIAALLLIGLLLGAGFFVYSAYVLILVLFGSRWLTHRWIDAVTVERLPIPDQIDIDQFVTIGVRVANPTRWYIPWLLVEEYLSKRATILPPVALEVEGSPLRLLSLPPKSQKILSCRIGARRRGYFQIGPILAECGDLLGLSRKYRVLSPPHYLLVLPKIIPLDGYDIASRRPVGEIRVSYRLMEDPTMTAGIREYQLGDPMRRVHWAATARTGRLHSKVYQPTCVAGAMFVLDLHSNSNPIRNEPVRSDLAVTAAVSFAHTLYQLQQPFGLVSNGRDAADRVRRDGWEHDFRSRDQAFAFAAKSDNEERLRPVIVPAGRGPEHFQQFHRTSARLECHSGMPLEALLAETQSRLPRDASVVVILQSVDDRAALAIGMLRRQGYAVTAIVSHFDTLAIEDASARLVAQHVPVLQLKDESSIPYLCRQMLLKY